jgi:hypothetical protein
MEQSSDPMRPAQHLTYRTPGGTQHQTLPAWVWPAAAILALFGSAAVFLMLESLINLPYRPPFDMSPTLSTDETKLFRVVQGACLILSVGAWAVLVTAWCQRHRYRACRPDAVEGSDVAGVSGAGSMAAPALPAKTPAKTGANG